MSRKAITADLRAFYKSFLEHNAAKMQSLLEETAAANPAKALDILLAMSEYVAPKLQRTELTGEGGGAVRVTLSKDERSL